MLTAAQRARRQTACGAWSKVSTIAQICNCKLIGFARSWRRSERLLGHPQAFSYFDKPALNAAKHRACWQMSACIALASGNTRKDFDALMHVVDCIQMKFASFNCGHNIMPKYDMREIAARKHNPLGTS